MKKFVLIAFFIALSGLTYANETGYQEEARHASGEVVKGHNTEVETSTSNRTQARQGKGGGTGPLGAGQAKKMESGERDGQAKHGHSTPSGDKDKPQKSGK